jgi:hypothetical protein
LRRPTAKSRWPCGIKSLSPKGGRSTGMAGQPQMRRGMIEGGALLPLGSERERGGHQGYALVMPVIEDLLSPFRGASRPLTLSAASNR